MHKIVVAITGASGSVYSKVLLDKLFAIKEQWAELSVVLTENAKTVWQTELDNDGYKNYPAKFYTQQDFNAPFASGSGQYDIMIIVPCSMGTLGRIAGGISNDHPGRSRMRQPIEAIRLRFAFEPPAVQSGYPGRARLPGACLAPTHCRQRNDEASEGKCGRARLRHGRQACCGNHRPLGLPGLHPFQTYAVVALVFV